MLQLLNLYFGKIKSSLFAKKDANPVNEIITYSGVGYNNVKTSYLSQPHGYLGAPVIDDDCLIYKGDVDGYANYILGGFTYVSADSKIICKPGESGICSRTNKIAPRYALMTKLDSVGVYWNWTSIVVTDKKVQYSTLPKGEELQTILTDILNEILQPIKAEFAEIKDKFEAHTHANGTYANSAGAVTGISSVPSNTIASYTPSPHITRDYNYTNGGHLLIDDNGSDLLE